MRTDLLTFEALPTYHDGDMLADALMNILEDYGIAEKVRPFMTCFKIEYELIKLYDSFTLLHAIMQASTSKH